MNKPAYRMKKKLVNELALCLMQVQDGCEITETPLRATIRDALLLRTTPAQRECMYLYYVVGLRQKALAAHLGTSQSCVSRKLKRGVRHVKDALRVCHAYGAGKSARTRYRMEF